MSGEGKAVFLSYASQDAEAARRVCDALRQAGVEVWFDAEGGLETGDEWDAKIRRQIKECVLFLPIISANTQARDEGYFRIEWDLAAERARGIASGVPFILPVVIDDTREPEALVPDRFRVVQWTLLPGGVVTPEVRQRFLKLWSHRVGALKSPKLEPGRSRRGSGLAPHGGAAASQERDEDAAFPAPGFSREDGPSALPGRSLYSLWRTLALAGVGALVALALWRPWKSPEPDASRRAVPPAPKTIASESGTRETATSPAVAALLARARSLVAKTDVVRSELDTAATLLDQAAKLEPTNPRVWAERSLVDYRYVDEYLDPSTVRRESARRHAAQAIGLDPELPLARFAQASALTLLQKDDATRLRAIQLLEPVIDRITDRADALYLLARLRKIEAALPLFDRAAQMPGELGRSGVHRAFALFPNRMQEADEAIDQSLAAERSVKAILLKSYFLMIWHGETEAAQRVITDVPSDVWGEDYAASARYFIELWAGNPDRALAAMRAVPRDFIESGALSGPTGYFRGFALARAGKPAAAEIEWRAALALVQRELGAKPNDAMLLTFSALLQWHLGDPAAALKGWQSIRELSGSRITSWENYFLQMTVLPEDEAIAKLEEAGSSAVWAFAANLRLDPYLDRLRQHPRFIAVQAKREADPKSSPRAAAAPAPSSAKSVAVLAFANLSDDKGNEYFSDGISEELLNVLAKVPGLKVSARTSAFYFKGKNTPIPEIAKQLGVAYVVEGSVRKAGDKVRIAAQLIKAADGFHVWSDTFTRDLKDIFAVQDEIAGLVAKNLQLRLGLTKPVSAAEENPVASRLYFEALAAWNDRSPAGLARAHAALRQALTLAPDFARAKALLSQTVSLRSVGNVPGMSATEALQLADEALAVDPQLASAHAARGSALEGSGRFAEALAELRRAVELDPNYATGHQWLARELAAAGLMAESLASHQRAAELDPLSHRILDNYSQAQAWSGDLMGAMATLDRALKLQPTSIQARRFRASYLLGLGRADEAFAIMADPEVAKASPHTHAQVLVAINRPDEARALLTSARSDFGRGLILCALGRGAEGWPLLKPSRSLHFEYILWEVAELLPRNDPAFLQALADWGLSEAWRRAEAWRAAHSPRKVRNE